MSGAARNEAGTDGKKKNKTIIIVIAIFAVVVAALIGVIIYLLNRGNDSDSVQRNETQREVADSIRTVLDQGSANNVMDQMREEVAEGMFECQMSMTWTFADGKAESQDAYVANSVNNTYPICFDVYMRDDTEKLLYSSPVLPVGTDLRNFKLDQELSAGSYQATVMYKLLEDEDSQEEISSAGFVVTINVLN